MFREATRVAFTKAGDNRRIKPFSETYNDRKANLLGHVLRASHEDPMRQVSFQTGSAYRVEYGKKRVGKPRQNWIHQTKKHVYVNRFSMFSIQIAR